jgi:hypothetical protein
MTRHSLFHDHATIFFPQSFNSNFSHALGHIESSLPVHYLFLTADWLITRYGTGLPTATSLMNSPIAQAPGTSCLLLAHFLSVTPVDIIIAYAGRIRKDPLLVHSSKTTLETAIPHRATSNRSRVQTLDGNSRQIAPLFNSVLYLPGIANSCVHVRFIFEQL